MGAYVLRERLAVGGMSEIFLASAADGSTVVVKVLGDRQGRDPVYRQFLRNEATLGHAMAHPNVVRVLGFGDAEGEPWVAMEYIDGVDLWLLQRALQRTSRRMEAPLACFVVAELLAGIAHVHAQAGPDSAAMIHRDVSPSNVFLSRAGEVKLGDLGIASGNSTPPGPTARGKLGYMAPEILLGLAVDQRVDLFSAGVVLAEVLTGQPLFPYTTGADVPSLLARRDRQVEELIDVLADHAPDLVAAVVRALARSPAERLQTAAAFRAAILSHAGPERESRELLGALVAWACSAGRALAGDEEEGTTDVKGAPLRDPETTVEVPLETYEVYTVNGALRGRYTYPRLIELAVAGGLWPDDRVVAPGKDPKRVAEMPELVAHLPQRTATTSEVAGAVPDWSEVIPGASFLKALSRLVFDEESGVLIVEAAPVRKEVYVHKGRLTHVASNLAGEMLGEYLVQQGEITRGELNMALAMLPRFDNRLTRALVELDLLDESRLLQLTDRMARDHIMDLFRWRRGTLRFFRGVTPPPTSVPLTMESFEVLRAGGHALEQPAEHFGPLLDRKLRRPEALPSNAARLLVVPAAHDLLASADGQTPIWQVLNRIAADRDVPPAEVLRELYLLLETGLVELDGQPVDAPRTD